MQLVMYPFVPEHNIIVIGKPYLAYIIQHHHVIQTRLAKSLQPVVWQ
jgi:hypothetical protein